MSEREQQQRLAEELGKVINHFRAEYDMTCASASGVLAILQFELLLRQAKEQEEGEE